MPNSLWRRTRNSLHTESVIARKHPEAVIVAAAHAFLWPLGAFVFFTACTAERPLSSSRAPHVKAPLAQVEPGPILITSRSQMAAISVDPPDSRMEFASEGAADAVRSVLNTPDLGHPQLEAAVGVLEFALVPFAGAYGAISAARERLSPDQLTEAEHNLVEAMRANAGSEVLREEVAGVVRTKTHRRLICAPSLAAAPVTQAPVGAVLEVAVEQLRLAVAKPGKSEYMLCFEARARLIRGSDGAVLLDRSYHYESGPALYIDWTRLRGLAGVRSDGLSLSCGRNCNRHFSTHI